MRVVCCVLCACVCVGGCVWRARLLFPIGEPSGAVIVQETTHESAQMRYDNSSFLLVPHRVGMGKNYCLHFANSADPLLETK